MRITVLTVPDCPHGPLARERVGRALDGRSAEVELVEVADEAEVARFGMNGSPTILIDGVDPFAVPGVPASVSCRLYRGPDGRVEGAPSVADLQRALHVADATADCGDLPMDAAGRAGRGRLAPTTGGLRAVQRAVLRHFAATGHAPDPRALDDIAASHGRDAADVLAELAAEDFITLDGQGRIRAAYPFSALPTAHRVRFPDGTQVWSMCAVDALGIPAMLDTDAVITSSDPVTGDAVTVVAADGQMDWSPPTAVIYVGQRSCTGMQIVNQALGDAFRGLSRGSSRRSGLSISYKEKPFYPRPLPGIDEERLARVRACTGCQVRYAVFDEHRFCPVCGRLPAASVAFDALQAETARLDALNAVADEAKAVLREQGVFTRSWVDTIENVVGVVEALASDVFETAVTDAADRLRGKGNVFQRLDDMADLFVASGYDDLRAILGPETWQRLIETWAARHVFTHNDGIVDEKYLRKVPTSSARVGRRLVISEAICRRAVEDTTSLCTALAELTV